MVPHQIRVQRRKCVAHLERVFLVHAEDDGLGEAVRLLEEVRQVPRDGLGACAERYHPLEVPGAILRVGDLPSVPVDLPLGGPPSGRVVVGDDAVDSVGGEEAVRDALSEAVLVERIAEVPVGIGVVHAARRRGHADLAGGLEPLQDLAPVAVSTGAAAMALVHDHQIEEVPRIFPVQAGAVLVACDGLIDGEVHVPALDRPAPGDLLARVAERAEILGHGVVHQDVAVGQEQDLRLAMGTLAVPASRPELPADLERDRGLAGAGAQRQQHTSPPPQHSLHRAVDRDLLVVAERLLPVGPSGCEQLLGGTIVGDPVGIPQPAPELVGLWELRHHALGASGVVALDDLGAVGGVGELEAEDLGVVLGLLQAIAGRPEAGLRFHHRDGKIWPIAQQVVRPLLPAAPSLATGKDNPTVRERALLVHGVRGRVPARGLQPGNDEFPAGIGFRQSHGSVILKPGSSYNAQTKRTAAPRPPQFVQAMTACSRVMMKGSSPGAMKLASSARVRR